MVSFQIFEILNLKHFVLQEHEQVLIFVKMITTHIRSKLTSIVGGWLPPGFVDIWGALPAVETLIPLPLVKAPFTLHTVVPLAVPDTLIPLLLVKAPSTLRSVVKQLLLSNGNQPQHRTDVLGPQRNTLLIHGHLFARGAYESFI